MKEHWMRKTAKSRLRSADRNWGAPDIGQGVPRGIEECYKGLCVWWGGGVDTKCRIQHGSNKPDQVTLVGNEDSSMGGIDHRVKWKVVNVGRGAPTRGGERLCPRSCSAGRCHLAHKSHWLSAVASGENCILRDTQNVPRYPFWDNITVAFFAPVYSDGAQWMATAASVKVCRVRSWIYWGVVGWHPKRLAVKKVGCKLDQANSFRWIMISYHPQPWRDRHHQTDAPQHGSEAESDRVNPIF